MHAKDWGYNESKTAVAVKLLDLITTLGKKLHNINQWEIDIHMDNI